MLNSAISFLYELLLRTVFAPGNCKEIVLGDNVKDFGWGRVGQIYLLFFKTFISRLPSLWSSRQLAAQTKPIT